MGSGDGGSGDGGNVARAKAADAMEERVVAAKADGDEGSVERAVVVRAR